MKFLILALILLSSCYNETSVFKVGDDPTIDSEITDPDDPNYVKGAIPTLLTYDNHIFSNLSYAIGASNYQRNGCEAAESKKLFRASEFCEEDDPGEPLDDDGDEIEISDRAYSTSAIYCTLKNVESDSSQVLFEEFSINDTALCLAISNGLFDELDSKRPTETADLEITHDFASNHKCNIPGLSSSKKIRSDFTLNLNMSLSLDTTTNSDYDFILNYEGGAGDTIIKDIVLKFKSNEEEFVYLSFDEGDESSDMREKAGSYVNYNFNTKRLFIEVNPENYKHRYFMDIEMDLENKSSTINKLEAMYFTSNKDNWNSITHLLQVPNEGTIFSTYSRETDGDSGDLITHFEEACSTECDCSGQDFDSFLTETPTREQMDEMHSSLSDTITFLKGFNTFPDVAPNMSFNGNVFE